MMREQCHVKVGFFSLKNCEMQPIGTCSACSRQVCQRHLTAGELCSECAAKQREGEEDEWDGDTIYTHRRRYYRSHRYSPIYHGYHDHDPYDDHDVRGFEEARAAGEVADESIDDDDGGFFDS